MVGRTPTATSAKTRDANSPATITQTPTQVISAKLPSRKPKQSYLPHKKLPTNEALIFLTRTSISKTTRYSPSASIKMTCSLYGYKLRGKVSDCT